MIKDSFLTNGDDLPVVQFSKLDQNNKAEFLEFLIKNNITFDNGPGKQNVVAKVTLKTLKTQNSSLKNNLTTNTKKMDKKQHQIPKNLKNNNNQNGNCIKKNTNENKSPLKNNSILINNKNLSTTSPFKKVKLMNEIQPDQKQFNCKTPKINELFKPCKNNKQEKNQNTETKSKHKTPQKTNLIIERSQQKSNKNLINQDNLKQKKKQREQLSSSAKNITYTKQSKQRLSNFKKQNIPKTTRNISVSKDAKDVPFYRKNNTEKSTKKIRDKSPNPNLNDSREQFRSQKQKFSCTAGNTELNMYSKNQSFESLQRIQLVNKYKEYFNNFSSLSMGKNTTVGLIKQRPVCWPLNQVQKFLDQFYDDNFIKNTNQILNGSKKLTDSLKKTNQSKISYLAEELQKFLNKKFNKVQKAIEYNLINLLYSLAYYISEFKAVEQGDTKSCSSSLRLFEDFITQKLGLEDYLFFLFTRNVLKQDFKKSFIAKSIINKKQIDRFLKHIVGQNNSQILEEYHRMIFYKVQDYEIEVNKFIKILIDDYNKKRLAAAEQTEARNHKKKCHSEHFQSKDFEMDEDSSLQNTFNKILNFGFKNDPKSNNFQNTQQIVRQDSMQELTFGEDTKDMLRQVELEAKINEDDGLDLGIQFWQSPYINQMNTKAQKQRLLRDQFNQMIVQKLCQKTRELVQILSSNSQTDFSTRKRHHTSESQQDLDEGTEQDGNQNDEQIQQIEQMLFSKALCLFFTVVEMNKVKWLKQLYIRKPSQEDIEKVEEIQLFFRKIKDYPTAKDIAEFCKLILTVSQITQELSKFFL